MRPVCGCLIFCVNRGERMKMFTWWSIESAVTGLSSLTVSGCLTASDSPRMLLLRSTLAGRSGCDQCFFFVELDLTTLEVDWEDSRGTAGSDATGEEG